MPAPSLQVGWGGEERLPSYVRLHRDGVEVGTVKPGDTIEESGRPVPIVATSHSDHPMRPVTLTAASGDLYAYETSGSPVLLAPTSTGRGADQVHVGDEFYDTGEWLVVTDVARPAEDRQWDATLVRLVGRRLPVEVWPTAAVATRPGTMIAENVA